MVWCLYSSFVHGAGTSKYRSVQLASHFGNPCTLMRSRAKTCPNLDTSSDDIIRALSLTTLCAYGVGKERTMLLGQMLEDWP
jgi:hypothetical protein